LLNLSGQLHASDILNSYFGGELVDYIVRFTVNLDPNVGNGKGITWPKYNTSSRQLVTFLDGLIPQTITTDTYRQDGISYLTTLSLAYPL
jgi:acetylcholinesterase